MIAESCPVLLDPRQHPSEPDGLGEEHGSASPARESEPVTVDDVDVAGPLREPLLEDVHPLVGQRRRDPCQHFVVVDRDGA